MGLAKTSNNSTETQPTPCAARGGGRHMRCAVVSDLRGETHRERGRLHCLECASRMLPEQPLIHGFTWKTAFYRGALVLHKQRTAQQAHSRAAAAEAFAPSAAVTALVLRTDQERRLHPPTLRHSVAGQNAAPRLPGWCVGTRRRARCGHQPRAAPTAWAKLTRAACATRRALDERRATSGRAGNRTQSS
jgi:hypothetical protein